MSCIGFLRDILRLLLFWIIEAIKSELELELSDFKDNM